MELEYTSVSGEFHPHRHWPFSHPAFFMAGPRITEVSLSLAQFIAFAGSSPAFYRISLIAPPFPESWRTVDSGLRFPSVQVMYLMTVIQFFGRPSTLPLTNQLQPSTSKTDKKLLRFFKKFLDIKKPLLPHWKQRLFFSTQNQL